LIIFSSLPHCQFQSICFNQNYSKHNLFYTAPGDPDAKMGVLIHYPQPFKRKIDYGSERFEKRYNKRTSVERVFSRLLSITMQRPSVIGLQATRNHCTIAHITVLLVALTAHRMGLKNNIRFVKFFYA